ncbi:SCAN domain-containing protein 3 [Trichonephila clavipes]|uniref:SCAN domain-containing protein 3 n=1 Tax=Trichonephila clavipes TaxID=2585209 RepID=A0A8X6WJ24_TRICX|nr:SCAN domain-containing protein 3 [Trichonephila clavipes]
MVLTSCYVFSCIFVLLTRNENRLNKKRFPFWVKEDIETKTTLNEIFEKISVLLDCPTVTSKKFVAVDDDNLHTALIITDKDISEFVQSSKNVIDADSEGENEMNSAALVPTSIRDVEHHEKAGWKYTRIYNPQRRLRVLVEKVTCCSQCEKSDSLANAFNEYLVQWRSVHPRITGGWGSAGLCPNCLQALTICKIQSGGSKVLRYAIDSVPKIRWSDKRCHP